MSCKTIVVHLDSGARTATRVDLATSLARRLGSRLVGIAPTGLPDVILAMNSAVPDAIECVALSAADLRESAEVAARDFEARCRSAGIGSFEARVEIGEPVDAVVRAGRCSDLVVVGQTDTAVTVDGVAFDFPQQVVIHCGAPVLVVPYAGTFTSIGANPLVAWKDAREAARALRDALPLLRSASAVTLVEFGETRTAGEANSTLDAAAAWLASHGLPVRTRRDPDLGDVGERLLSLASDVGCDLIVAGGYGHSRLREWALGGVTRHLLQHMTVPTLLSH